MAAYPLDLETKVAVTNFSYAISLRKNEPKLRAHLNAWVSTHIQNGKLNEIYLRRHGYRLPPDYRP